MKLTSDNYHSQEANAHYLSASGIKAFRDCEAAFIATVTGLREPSEPSAAMLVGSYVDCRLLEPEKYPAFREEHRPDIYKKGGFKRADFERADEMIAAVQRQAYAVNLLKGDHQTIMTGEIGGVYFKGKFDVLNVVLKRLVDLKTTADVNGKTWCPTRGRKVGFIELWDYWTQMVIYLELCRQGGINIESCYIVAVDKKSPPAVRVYDMHDIPMLQEAHGRLLATIERYKQVRGGHKPARCGDCEHCRETELIDAPLAYTDTGWN